MNTRTKKIVAKVLSFLLVMATLVTLAASMVGCSKKTEETEIEKEPIVFQENEAFRLGEYPVGMDLFMLYAIDVLPGFVNEFGVDCFEKDSIDLGWIIASPTKAFILYVTDIMASSISCDIYYTQTVGELDKSIKDLCSSTAKERYEALLEVGMPEDLITENSLYLFECSIYKLSYVVNQINIKYGEDVETAQSAILGMRDAIDPYFSYGENINWELVEQVDYSAAVKDLLEEIEEDDYTNEDEEINE